MITESTKEQKDSPGRNQYNPSYYIPAKKLVDEIFEEVRAEPLLKILAWLKARIPENDRDLNLAVLNLIAAAFEHSDVYYNVIEKYADSLLDESVESNKSPAEKSITEKASGIVDSIILLMTDERLTDGFRKRLAQAATEMMNDLSKGEEVLFSWLRSHFDEGRERVAKASASEESHLSDSSEKVMKTVEWATSHRMPSRKLDLMAALVDVEDELMIDALIVALQGKGGNA